MKLTLLTKYLLKHLNEFIFKVQLFAIILINKNYFEIDFFLEFLSDFLKFLEFHKINLVTMLSSDMLRLNYPILATWGYLNSS